MNKEVSEAWADAAQMLEKAADLLESGILGWIQGQMLRTDESGKIVSTCAWGTLRYVEGVETDRVQGDEIRVVSQAYTLAYTALEQSLLPTETVPSWNDADGRTKEDVIEAMKTTAKNVRNWMGRREPA